MNRDYIAISIKHTEYKWKVGMPCLLWGYHRTADDEKRCFSGYTFSLQDAERYSAEDFENEGYSSDIVKREPVPMSFDLCKKWKKYDTVLVKAEEYASYLKMCGLDYKGDKMEVKQYGN